ncbi:MAG: hypothetical protein OXK77_12590 [Gemmatimonadota bacterium]|nr:hypothetical protein [Gemmatimonadota bacterium]MDE2864097.1 hypothetical protein [Gemmatimonadota bacterium]
MPKSVNDVELLRRRLVRIRDDAVFEDWRRDAARAVLVQLDEGTVPPAGIRRLLRATRPVDDLP